MKSTNNMILTAPLLRIAGLLFAAWRVALHFHLLGA
jgi:hypothetical protein